MCVYKHVGMQILVHRHTCTHMSICIHSSVQNRCTQRRNRPGALHSSPGESGRLHVLKKDKTRQDKKEKEKERKKEKEKGRGRARWPKAVMPALWEAERGGSQGQEIESTLANTVNPRLY